MSSYFPMTGFKLVSKQQYVHGQKTIDTTVPLPDGVLVFGFRTTIWGLNDGDRSKHAVILFQIQRSQQTHEPSEACLISVNMTTRQDKTYLLTRHIMNKRPHRVH